MLVSKGWVQSQITVQTLSWKKQTDRGIGKIASGFSRGLINNNVEFSGHDQEKNMISRGLGFRP